MENKIQSIIIDKERSSASFLRKCIHSKFPEISIDGEASNFFEASRLVHSLHPRLVFSDIEIISRLKNTTTSNDFEFVCLSNCSEDAIGAIRQDACGFILKPLSSEDIIVAVESALRKLLNKTSHQAPGDSLSYSYLPHTRLIGVPTLEGIDFLYAHEIIRCEGLQKCTRIVSTRNKSLISSYSIGEFRKLLEGYGFFPCHKSHLINLMYVKKLTREGFIFLSDKDAVPLARRKRIEFLQMLRHL